MYSVTNVTKSYGRKTDIVLRDISFDIDRGEILGILGVNGVGKTTLVKILLRALEPSAGRIEFLGKDLSKTPLSAYYRNVSAVLEGDRNTYWYLTGLQNMRYFGRLKNLREAEISNQAVGLLKTFDLWDARDQTVGEYSRGMRQKLSIIIAMLGDPEVLFLDEPTLGLDTMTKKAVMAHLENLARQKKTTVVLTSHELDVIDAITDRVLVLEHGSIAYVGRTSDFKQLYSENKYTLTVKGTVKTEDVLSDGYTAKEREGMTDITYSTISDDDINRVLRHLLEKRYEVIAFSKDSSRLEDIMEAFLRRKDHNHA